MPTRTLTPMPKTMAAKLRHAIKILKEMPKQDRVQMLVNAKVITQKRADRVKRKLNGS